MVLLLVKIADKTEKQPDYDIVTILYVISDMGNNNMRKVLLNNKGVFKIPN